MKLTTAQVAKMLGVTDRHVRRLIDEKTLIAEKESGKEWMITKSSVESFKARNEKVKKAMDSFIKNYGSSVIITSVKTSERLEQDGFPIKSKFIPNDEFLVTLFQEKRTLADKRIKLLPRLDEKLGSAVATSLYNEFRECFILGVNGAAITLAIILLEYSMKHKILEGKAKINSNAGWKGVEFLSFAKSIEILGENEVISESEKILFEKFNTEVRNNYMHYKIRTLIKIADMVISELPAINTNTGEVVIYRDVDVKEKPQLWFSAKKKLDEDTVMDITSFCIDWTNKFLKN